MHMNIAIDGLSALALAGRLEIFRLLVKTGPEGMAAGDIARAIDARPNTLSANLNILSGAGLVRSQRQGRSIIYRADYERMRDLLAFLMEDCCAGDASICAPLAEIVSRAACCEPSRGVPL